MNSATKNQPTLVTALGRGARGIAAAIAAFLLAGMPAPAVSAEPGPAGAAAAESMSCAPLTLLLGDGVSLQLLPIPAGRFVMGTDPAAPLTDRDEVPHAVRITTPFLMGRTEVTQEQWRALASDCPSSTPGDNVPVTRVSWNDAMAWLEEANRRLAGQLPAGTCLRLPTEAEWEYACRAGTTTSFFFGDDPAAFGAYGWSAENGGDRPQPVARKKPNPWGLYDMHGNVYEWCADLFGAYEMAAEGETVDPVGHAGHSLARTIRGGAFNEPTVKCRSANRTGNGYFDKRRGHMGFRVVVGRRLPVPMPPAPAPVQKRVAPPKPAAAPPPMWPGDAIDSLHIE